MATKKTLPLNLLFVDRQRLTYFGALSQPVILDLPGAVVRDLEVLDEDGFAVLFKNFVLKNKISTSQLVVVLAENVYFTKDILELDPTKLTQAKDEYLKSVPFQNITSKSFKLAKGERVVAFNHALFEMLYHAVNPLGFTIASVIPQLVISKISKNTLVDQAIANLILSKAEFFKDDNLISGHEYERPETEEIVATRQYNTGLLGLFGLLMALTIGLIIYYFLVLTPQANKKASSRPSDAKKVTMKITPSPTQKTLEVKESTPAGSLATTAVSIQVINASGVSGLAARIKQQLVKAGFTNVGTDSAETRSNQKTLIVFSPNVAQSVREAVVAIVAQVLPDITTQENNDSQADIIITTGTGKIL